MSKIKAINNEIVKNRFSRISSLKMDRFTSYRNQNDQRSMFDYISSAEMLFCHNLSSAAVREDRISQCYSTYTCISLFYTMSSYVYRLHR